MSKQVLSKPHLELKEIGRTTFQTASGTYSVMGAPAQEFDAWILQFVETIENVDRAIWEPHHRWNIINAVLEAGLLIITPEASGAKLERVAEAGSEEKTSEPEAEKGTSQKPEEQDGKGNRSEGNQKPDSKINADAGQNDKVAGQGEGQ